MEVAGLVRAEDGGVQGTSCRTTWRNAAGHVGVTLGGPRAVVHVLAATHGLGVDWAPEVSHGSFSEGKTSVGRLKWVFGGAREVCQGLGCRSTAHVLDERRVRCAVGFGEADQGSGKASSEVSDSRRVGEGGALEVRLVSGADVYPIC